MRFISKLGQILNLSQFCWKLGLVIFNDINMTFIAERGQFTSPDQDSEEKADLVQTFQTQFVWEIKF